MKFTFSISSSVWIVFACLMSFGDAQTMLTAPFGHFSSPNYPGAYGNDIDMSWMIKVKPNYRIKLEFSTFDLEDSYDEDNGGSCIYDYVKLSLGAKTERLCGNRFFGAIDAPSPGQVFLTEGNNATVQFVSDYSSDGSGFLAHYSEIDVDECANQREKELYTTEDWDELLTCDHFCNNVPGSFYCSCRAGYTLHSDKHTCIATLCERNVYNNDTGDDFQSPGYSSSGKYSKYANCSWRITVSEGLEVNLFFAGNFEIEKHVDEGCVYDILKIEYGGNETYACGTTLPEPIFTNARDVMITFTSDRSVEMRGFEIFYNTTIIRCLEELGNPEHGKINTSDVGDRGYYQFEDEVNFICDTGYEFKPGVASRLECLSNGSWSDPQPICTIKVCGEPTHLMNISNVKIEDFDTKQFVFNETLTIKCDEWYEMTRGWDEYTCSDAKTWVPTGKQKAPGLPKCKPKCGEKGIETNTSALVAGGTRVKNHYAWPWMAFIDMGGDHDTDGGRKGEDYCGGTLIDEHTVLTAAHCVMSIDVGGFVTVWLGILDRYEDNFTFTQSFVVPYENITLHEFFRNTGEASLYRSFDYDVAVLKLLTAAQLSDNVHPICLPLTDDNQKLIMTHAERRRPVILGWGKTEHGNFSRHLMKARVDFVSRDECRRKYERKLGKGAGDMITDRVICAGLKQNNGTQRDSCSGDSGGPLMSEYNVDRKWYLNGIVSFGYKKKGCGKSPTYGGYTNVEETEVARFINDNLE